MFGLRKQWCITVVKCFGMSFIGSVSNSENIFECLRSVRNTLLVQGVSRVDCWSIVYDFGVFVDNMFEKFWTILMDHLCLRFLCFYWDSSDEKCWYLLSVACCLLSVVCCLLSVVWCLVFVVCCLLAVVCCLLPAACCLYVFCCPFSLVCCLLTVVWCPSGV